MYAEEESMISPVLTFFNNKGGVGKTSLIYHLAWMFASLRKRIVAADLDPQANLTAAFLIEEEIEAIWEEEKRGSTVYRCVEPLASVGDIAEPHLRRIAADLYLLPGDVHLSRYEEVLSMEWPNSMGITISIVRCEFSAPSGRSCKWPPKRSRPT